jgi:hypothetical protein
MLCGFGVAAVSDRGKLQTKFQRKAEPQAVKCRMEKDGIGLGRFYLTRSLGISIFFTGPAENVAHAGCRLMPNARLVLCCVGTI